MRILGRVVPLKYAVGAAAVLLAISGSVAVVATTSFDAKPPPHVAVPGVSAERLAEGGISLSPASAAEASVTPDSAVRAGSVLGLSKVRGTVLAQLHDSSSVPNIDRLVWVVSSSIRLGRDAQREALSIRTKSVSESRSRGLSRSWTL